MNSETRFAVLIDADNISGKYIKVIMDEIANHGVATYKRIYGDWTSPSLSSWKPVLLDNSVIPIQQYSYTTGKSSTDSAMIIDAMDILFSGNVDGFCIVSSDSDFTRLAARLRESGMTVIGMGESKTPKPFIAACNQFKYLNILLESTRSLTDQRSSEKPARTAKATSKSPGTAKAVSKKAQPPESQPDTKTASLPEARTELTPESEPQSEPRPEVITDLDTIRDAIAALVEEGSDEDGWLSTGQLGNLLARRYPDFDLRNFGYRKLTPFIRSLKIFDIKNAVSENNLKTVQIKLK
jgi:hypothetical protein